MNRHLILALLLALFSSVQAQLANQPPTPQWLTVSGNSPADSVTLTVRFEHEGNLLKAILMAASDTAAEVTVNGRKAGRLPPREGKPATTLDLTTLIRTGGNELSITGSSLHIAALLELNGDLARKRWIISDAAWQAPNHKIVLSGPVDAEPAANPFDLKKAFDAYNSWQLAKQDAQTLATDPATLTLPPGFKAELIRSAQGDDGSWVSMAFDPQGRITLAREKQGLLRLDLKDHSVRVIEDTLLECRGLLYAHGVLYANANNSKGLYRLRDLDGDGVFEDKKELMHTEGGVGHGRNHIKLGPDGRIWVAHGNNVLLPSPLAESSPLRHYATDQVLPNPWDGSMFDGNVELPAGHVIAINPEDGKMELIAGGLRNPLDLAFNHEGELFTFDADMERDVGASWYMPTRVLHIVPGADFGWRRGTGRFPAWYADALPSVIDIGLSSPTGVFFGYGAKLPARYQEALFILDWTYGRIIAVHLKEKGASYAGTQEPFVSGRPLNVTDGCIGPDGALWFITGGRGTQSGLYRITYAGTDETAPIATAAPKSPLRDLRHQLEALQSGIPAAQREAAFALAWPNMKHDDIHIRWAARVALEQLPPSLWKGQVMKQSTDWQAILGCLALARVGEDADRDSIASRLISLPWQKLDPEQRLAVLRTLSVNFARHGDPVPDQKDRVLNWLEPKFPATTRELNQELTRLLVRLKSGQILTKAAPLAAAATASEDLLFYPLHLRYLTEGWTLETRRVMFEALNRAEKLNGASSYFKAIQDTRTELAAALPADQSAKLAALIFPPKPAALSPHAVPTYSFKVWKLEDLEPRLKEIAKGRSFEKGKAAVISAQCVFCHKVSNDPALPGGVFGPELVQISARFNARDLLDHILNPSKVIDEKFRFLTLTRTDGTQITGSLEREDDERVTLRPNPLSPGTVEVGKSMIRDRKLSEVSPMPPGLLNVLKAEQILDLLAFLEAGGDPKHPSFQP